MIAVEWRDFNAPRGPLSTIIPRTGVLLSLGMARVRDDHELQNCAWILVTAMDHDSNYRSGLQSIIPVRLTAITVKGVHIPFEP